MLFVRYVLGGLSGCCLSGGNCEPPKGTRAMPARSLWD